MRRKSARATLRRISEDVAIERLGGDDDARARVQEELDRIEDGRKKE